MMGYFYSVDLGYVLFNDALKTFYLQLYVVMGYFYSVEPGKQTLVWWSISIVLNNILCKTNSSMMGYFYGV